MPPFSDRLGEAVERKRSQLVVGLDPNRDVGDLDAFCRRIVDAVAPHAVAVKPQSAFFEAAAPTACAPSATRARTRERRACS